MAHRSLLQHIDYKQTDLRQLDRLPHKPFHAISCGDSHKGYIRIFNEDAYLELPNEKLWVVADGMGGHKRGDYASKAVINALKGFSCNSNKDSLINIIEDLQNRLLEANEVCQKAFRAKRVGSTIVLLFEYCGHCFFLWAGDSRIYRLRNGEIQQMTRDHSLAQEKYEKGELNQDEAKTHHSAHILTRAVGVHRHLRLELDCCPAQAGDRYLLCTDGLHDLISDQELHSKLAIEASEDAVQSLIESALTKGGRDNITAVIVDIAECTTKSP